MKITEQNFIKQIIQGNEKALEYCMLHYGGLVKTANMGVNKKPAANIARAMTVARPLTSRMSFGSFCRSRCRIS